MTTITSAGAPPIIKGLSDLAARYEVILSDVWGVVHNGMMAHASGGDALTRFRSDGGTVVMVSNAPRPHPDVKAMLDHLGVPSTAYDAIVTSGDVTRDLIAALPDRRIHHIGPARDLPVFAGLSISRVALDDASAVVCTGLFDDERETVADYADMLDAIRARQLTMICANPDLVVERGSRLIPCAGAIAAAYEAKGGRVLQAGKPYAPIYARAITEAERARGRPIEPARCLGIGDAIRTDVAGAARQGIDSLFVMTGIHWHELSADGAVVEPAYRRFMEAAIPRPTWAIDRLRW